MFDNAVHDWVGRIACRLKKAPQSAPENPPTLGHGEINRTCHRLPISRAMASHIGLWLGPYVVARIQMQTVNLRPNIDAESPIGLYAV